ncbi:MAG: hypothetical protein JNJ40_04650 [Bacteroidia bacterium]|nr:hypothetical protein [Bacteroidia bacterium]
MILSKSEFCQFSLKAKKRLVMEYGELLLDRSFIQEKVCIYKIYEFHVEAIYNKQNNELIKMEPIFSIPLLKYYVTAGKKK